MKIVFIFPGPIDQLLYASDRRINFMAFRSTLLNL